MSRDSDEDALILEFASSNVTTEKCDVIAWRCVHMLVPHRTVQSIRNRYNRSCRRAAPTPRHKGDGNRKRTQCRKLEAAESA